MITVVISDWCVPYDQVVREIKAFEDAESAVAYINAASLKWWNENDGDRYVEENKVDFPVYEPIKELGYDEAHYELWDGEQGFHAMIDNESYARLHEEHYKRECDDKGLKRPGYIRTSYLAGHQPH